MRLSLLNKKRLLIYLMLLMMGIFVLMIRVFYLKIVKGEFLENLAYEQQIRDRTLTPERGKILDRNLVPIAETIPVNSIYVIRSQIKEEEKVARVLSEKLELDYNLVLKKVRKRVMIEKIKSKVDKSVADSIRKMNLEGIVIDEDYKRFYPYSNLAAQVIGFCGKDNQGIIGLEVKYDSYLKGIPGKIFRQTDAKGKKIHNILEKRIEPTSGNNLVTSIDVMVQQYVEQALEKVLEAKDAKRGALIVINPQNGEILAMANKPDYDLNKPYEVKDDIVRANWEYISEKEKNDLLNSQWRNLSINDTYEPGSTFKMVTSASGLEEKVVKIDDNFNCPGYKIVADRMIKCWRYPRSHGTETFVQGVQNSCNPVFMEVAERMGVSKFYQYIKKFGFYEKTGVDLPGEATGIFLNQKRVGPVELATMAFGQSFQITPIQLLRAASAVVNGGNLITPHFAIKVVNFNNEDVKVFNYKKGNQVISKETSDQLRYILESVVSEGTGSKAYIPGYQIGGKTATSEKLPRRTGKYIASFVGFAPADNPTVMALVLIDEPQGVYYGGTIAAPVIKEVFGNILPYLNIQKKYTEKEIQTVPKDIAVPDYTDKEVLKAKNELISLKLQPDIKGDGKKVTKQFPLPGEPINANSKVILYTN